MGESDSKVPTSVLSDEEIDLDLLDLIPEDDHEDNDIDDPDYETKVPNNKQNQVNDKQSKTNKQEEEQVLKNENDELQCYYCCQIFLRSAIEDHMRYGAIVEFSGLGATFFEDLHSVSEYKKRWG